MKSTFGNSLVLTIFGESHGPAIGATLAGLAPGFPIDSDFIREKLALRAPQGQISTARKEADDFEIISGVFQNKTTGTPLTIIIRNQNTRSADYTATAAVLRPGHADYTAECKYHGFQDYRGGGHFSGRITAALVAVLAVCEQMLLSKNILIGTHIKECAGISDSSFQYERLNEQVKQLNQKIFPVLDEKQGQKMQKKIIAAKSEKDSVGGILETVIIGIEAGLGEPWFDSIESMLAHAMFSIPAIKGIAFGDGFAFAGKQGSQANDSPYITDRGEIAFRSNHNGGINGGISNGMPIVFNTVVKPTPSIAQAQDSINLKTRKAETIEIKGRHDPAIIHRARQVVNALTAFVLCDFLTLRYGTDWPFQN